MKLEFIPEFYHPERGDKILSPKDARCVYWDIASEVTDEADAVWPENSNQGGRAWN
jgi:hypothetical protein